MSGFENHSDCRASDDTAPGGSTLLDVRGHDEFARGHLPGAVNVPVAELASRLNDLGSKLRPIFVYCRSGRRSALAADLLQAAGFSRVIDLGGWNDSGAVG